MRSQCYGGNRSIHLAWTVLAVGLVVSACGSGDSGGPSDGRGGESGDTGAGGDGAESGGTSSGGSGGPGNGGSGARAGDGSGAAPGGAGEGTGGTPDRPDLEPGEDGPGYDGVDLDGLDLTTAPEGCLGGFDPALGSLAIALDTAVPVVLIQVIDGSVHANGTACESADGQSATADAVVSIAIAGTDGDEAVYVDTSGAFGNEFLSASGGLVIELGAGSDELVVLGSDEADDIAAGSNDGTVLVDFSGDGEPDLAATVESLVVSTGPRADLIRCDGARLGIPSLHVPARLHGGGANDVIFAGTADDAVFGGIGNDSLNAGTSADGADVYDGGDGSDEVDYSARSSALSVTLEGGADDGETDEGDEVLPSVENVVGSQGPNELTGNELPNRLFGGAADDTLVGGPGGDTLVGGEGDDALLGEEGDDQVYGELGDDDLQGGPGDDIVDGFSGRDVIDGGLGDGDICSFTSEDTVSACEL